MGRPVLSLRAIAGFSVGLFLLASLGCGAARAEAVQIKHGGLTLNAELSMAPGKAMKDGIVLLTHGSLAHNHMELIEALQKGLEERGVSSLAINLGLGIDNRASTMLDCKVAHRHRHEDALDEIGAWLAWLKAKGAANVTLMGHSRGGNQTAWFAAERLDPAVKRVVLLAPATWDAAKTAKAFEARTKQPLKPLLDKAMALVKAGKGGEMMKVPALYACQNATASAATFVSYYRDDARKNTPTLLPRIKAPVLVIWGSEDNIVTGLADKVKPYVDGKKVRLKVIDGANHFFLDFYAEDVADAVAGMIAGK